MSSSVLTALLLVCVTAAGGAPEPAMYPRHVPAPAMYPRNAPEPPPHVVFRYGAGLPQDQESTGSTLVRAYTVPEEGVRRYSVGGGVLRRHGAAEHDDHGQQHGAESQTAASEVREQVRPHRRRRPAGNKRKAEPIFKSDYPTLDFMEAVIKRYRELGCSNMWRGDERTATLERCAAASAQTYLMQLRHQAQRLGALHPPADNNTEADTSDETAESWQRSKEKPEGAAGGGDEHPQDAGSGAAEDSSTPSEDSGAPAEDSGTPAEDSGAPAEDSGTPAEDSGAPAAALLRQTGPPTGGLHGPSGLLAGRQARQLNWTIWADYMDPKLLNHRLGAAEVTSGWTPGGAAGGQADWATSGKTDWVPSAGTSWSPSAGHGTVHSTRPSAGPSAGSSGTAAAVSAEPEPFVPPHLRDDFPYDIRVIHSGMVNLAPPAVNGVQMQPGPLSELDRNQAPYRQPPPAQGVDRLWDGLSGGADSAVPVLAVAAFVAVAALLVTATSSVWDDDAEGVQPRRPWRHRRPPPDPTQEKQTTATAASQIPLVRRDSPVPGRCGGRRPAVRLRGSDSPECRAERRGQSADAAG